MWVNYCLFRITFILVAVPKLVLNTVLNPQSSAPDSEISFDSSVLFHDDPNIDTTINDLIDSEDQMPFKASADNDSNDTGAIAHKSENPETLLANTDSSSLNPTFIQSIMISKSDPDSLVSNEEADALMSGSDCVDSNMRSNKAKRFDWNPLHWSLPSLPWETNFCPFTDTSPERKNTPADPPLKPKTPKKPSRNPTHVETGQIPIINGGRRFGGERSCKDTHPPRLKTLICGGPTEPVDIIPARLVHYCFSCTWNADLSFCLRHLLHSLLLKLQRQSPLFDS
ncbi:hypothetical protein MMC29_004038 [Sticta canariensis]|nr:hypothetical protein [Sticta canariensis]